MRAMVFGDLFHVEDRPVPNNMPIGSASAWNSQTEQGQWDHFYGPEPRFVFNYWKCYLARLRWDMLGIPFKE